MNKFQVTLGIKIELAPPLDTATLSVFIERCNTHSINIELPIRVYAPVENVCYWANQVGVDANTSQIVMLRSSDDNTSVFTHNSRTWTPSKLRNINCNDSFKLVDANLRPLELLGWGKDDIVFKSRIESCTENVQ